MISNTVAIFTETPGACRVQRRTFKNLGLKLYCRIFKNLGLKLYCRITHYTHKKGKVSQSRTMSVVVQLQAGTMTWDCLESSFGLQYIALNMGQHGYTSTHTQT